MAHKHHTSEAGKNLIISIILNLFIVVFELMVKIKNLLRNNFKINYSAIQMLSEKEAKKNRS
ncbi:MAG: hypothetical protein GWO87_03350 [Xanthomonadaceae bacterium]|nr:hypothetical protein [Rhodospirillaceae bacterium]NIA18197.1 hypothetical protein [Xanthomonadaceae bacterium]